MPGQCFACGAEFGMFKKEHGCKNCGFAFCSKCLHEKSIPVPKRNNAKHRVCHKCFRILNGEIPAEAKQKSYDLPEAYLKRMAALKEKESTAAGAPHKNSAAGADQKIPAHLQNLDKPDRDIAMRLERLKEDKKVKVSDSDLNARLARLKGQTYDPGKKPVYQAPDRRTQVEQTDDLLEQVSAEVDIDALRPDPVKHVESRLAQLKHGEEVTTREKPTVDVNNTNQEDKSQSTSAADAGNNDLGKVDKMGAFGKSYSKNISGSTEAATENELNMEEMQQLLAQATTELEADARRQVAGLEQDERLMERLREIQRQRQQEGARSAGAQTHNGDSSVDSQMGQLGGAALGMEIDESDEENEDEEASKVLQRYLEEAKIEEKAEQDGMKKKVSALQKKRKEAKASVKGQKPSSGKTFSAEGSDSDSDYDDSDELPYCCICTEDALLRCRDCDLDLYCARCFRESHQEMEIMDHRTTPYKAPKGYR